MKNALKEVEKFLPDQQSGSRGYAFHAEMFYCQGVRNPSLLASWAEKEFSVTLSEHERKLLAEMEEAFLADDPRLVSTLTGNRLYPGRNRALLGVGLVSLGIVTIFVGLIVKVTLVGVLGFLIALVGVVLTISGLSGVSSLRSRPTAKKNSKRKLNSRLEDRWERRNFDQ